MGRRSQRSRANQAKERAKREVKESGRSDDVIDEPTGNDAVGESSEGDVSDNLSQADATGKDMDGDMSDDSSQADTAVEHRDSGDSPDASSEAEVIGEDDNDDTLDAPSETEVGSEDDSGDALNASTDTEAAVEDDDEDTSSDTEPSDAAAGYASIEADQNPQTCCPNCRTIFEVSPELLASSDTRVRCGECLSIFDALANLRHQNGDTEADEPHAEFSGGGLGNAGEQPDPGDSRDATGALGSEDDLSDDPDNNPYSLDVTYADFSLFSADAALPDIDYLDETREANAFNFDDPGGDDDLDETYSDTLFAQGPEVDARSAINESDSGTLESAPPETSDTADGTEDQNISESQNTTESGSVSQDGTLTGDRNADEMDELLGSLQRPQPHVTAEVIPAGTWRIRIALLLLVLALAGGLYGYRERESLLHSEYLRPVLESVCSVFGCTLAEHVDLAALQVLKRSVFSHPKLDNMLVINVDFVNKAAFSQRYPVLEIRLTDRTGGLVIKNSFEPSDYLDNWHNDDLLAAGERLGISLNVEDPGNQAMSFELDFR